MGLLVQPCYGARREVTITVTTRAASRRIAIGALEEGPADHCHSLGMGEAGSYDVARRGAGCVARAGRKRSA
jgi:hypothetical protein